MGLMSRKWSRVIEFYCNEILKRFINLDSYDNFPKYDIENVNKMNQTFLFYKIFFFIYKNEGIVRISELICSC